MVLFVRLILLTIPTILILGRIRSIDMCDNPRPIKNLNCNLNYGNVPGALERAKALRPWVDFESSQIMVPCGHCPTCIRNKQMGIVQRVQMESLKNHLFMCTLTYAPEVIPVMQVGDYNIRYADTEDLKRCIKMLRKYDAFGIPFRTLWVSELGSSKGRPHFHVLFLFPKEFFPLEKEDYISECDSFASKQRHYFTVLNYWRRNIGSRRAPVWQKLTRYVEKWQNGVLRKNYDFHYINPFLTSNGVEDCGMYVLKYMFKPSDRETRLQQALKLNLHPVDYDVVWNKVRPRYSASIGFGYNALNVQLRQGIFEKDPDIVSRLRESIETSRGVSDFPGVYHEFTGKQMMLSSYYKRNMDIYTYEDRLHFWDKQVLKKSLHDGGPHDLEIPNVTDRVRARHRLAKTSSHCDSLGVDADFDLLDT